MDSHNETPQPVGSLAIGSPILSEAERERLEELFNAGAARMDAAPEHWIHGADEGLSYCYECAEKEVAKLLKEEPDGKYCVDGGWGTTNDSTPFCESCQKLLSSSLTDYGCEAEVDHFTAHGFDPKSDDDCRAMSEVVSARGWEEWSGRVFECEYQRTKSEKYFADLHALGRAILDLANAQLSNSGQP